MARSRAVFTQVSVAILAQASSARRLPVWAVAAAVLEASSLDTRCIDLVACRLVQIEMLVEAAARGVVATGGRHAAGAAVAAAVRTIWVLAAPDPADCEVAARLGMVRPSLSCLVRGGRASAAEQWHGGKKAPTWRQARAEPCQTLCGNGFGLEW